LLCLIIEPAEGCEVNWETKKVRSECSEIDTDFYCLGCKSDGYYYDEVNKGCSECDESCSTCAGKNNADCLICSEDYYNLTQSESDNGSCINISSCLYPMYRDDDTKTCYNYSCSKCSEYLQPSETCKSYTKVNSEYNCTECISTEYVRLRLKCEYNIASDCVLLSNCPYTIELGDSTSETACYKSTSIVNPSKM